MDGGIKIKLDGRPLAGKWDPEQALGWAIRERERFLQQNPGCRRYQIEIDQLLDKAGSSENRIGVIALLMQSKLIELHQQLRQLNALLPRST